MFMKFEKYPTLIENKFFCKKKKKKRNIKLKQTPFCIFFFQSELEGLKLRFRRSSSKVYIVSYQY